MTSQIVQALLADTHQANLSLTSTFANGLVATTAGQSITTSAAIATLLGANETLTVTSNNATVAALGATDTVTTAASRIAFIAMGANETLIEQSAGATITLDPTQAIAANSTVEIDASFDTIVMQRLATVLTAYSTGWGSGWGCGQSYGVPQHTADVTIVGDHNLIATGAISTGLDIIGHFNVIRGGSGAIDVTLDTNAAAANVVIGGSGCMNVVSTAVATKIIGGTGNLTVDITASAASIFGGSGTLDATIHGNGGDYQTGSGTANIDFTGFGGVFATGSGTSEIDYSGAGGLLYEANASGTALFDATGNGIAIFGGDVVNTLGNGNEVYTRDNITTRYPTSYLSTIFTSGISSFLPNTAIAAALAATGDAFLPAGIQPATASPCSPSGGYASNWCWTPPRIINFQGDGGAVHTGDRLTYVSLNGNNNSIYAGRIAQSVCITAGSGNGIYAGLGGGNNFYDGGPGQNYLDYQGSPAPVIVNLALGLARNGYGGLDTIQHLNRVDASGGSTLIAGRADATLTVHGDAGILVGGTGNDTLYGTGASTSFVTGAGTDTIKADGANDSYLVCTTQSGCPTSGTTTIDQAALGTTGTLTFANVAKPSQLWFHQDATNDLVVTVLGTTNTTTFEHWFATDATTTQLARIAGTSAWLDNAGINAVQQAMATYEAAHPGYNPSANSILPTDPNIQAALNTYLHAA